MSRAERKGNIAATVVFAAVIMFFFVYHLLLPDVEVSRAERRKLQQLPTISVGGVFSGEFMQQLEDYVSDQFPLRDELRALQSAVCFGILGQMDNKGVYIIDETVFKSDAELSQSSVQRAADKINSVKELYLDGSNSVFYSVIPDKNYFAAEKNGYPHMDYDRLLSVYGEALGDIEYIDIFDTLGIEDYYRTDIHWRQEKILDTADVLLLAMTGTASDESYTENSLYPFYGAYYGQAGLPVPPDYLVYLTSPTTENSLVSALDTTADSSVYVPGRIDGMDGYDVFLSGAQSVITVKTENEAGRRLVLIRDSFGSSIAPLLLDGYSEITLVDLRYIASDRLADYVEFEGADVLFLYSTTLINSAGVLK